MKSKIFLLALIAVPWLLGSVAQAQAQTVRVAKSPQEALPDAQQLLGNLFAPYEAAATFRGNFAVSIEAEGNAIAEIGLETRFRIDESGKLQRQWSRMKIVGRAKPKEQQTIMFIDNGLTQKIVLEEQKVWWNASERDDAAALFTLVKPLVDQVVQTLEDYDDFTPVASRGVESGRAVTVLKAKKGNVFRAVMDAQTRALRSFVVKDTVAIDATNPVFNAPINDAEFEWSAPADYRQVAPGEVMPPASLGISVPGIAATPTG